MGKKQKRHESEEKTDDEKDTSTRLKKKAYEKALKDLNVELVKLQEWVKHTGHRSS
jgi:polyphosphate kinase 2 (PPK2 family)